MRSRGWTAAGLVAVLVAVLTAAVWPAWAAYPGTNGKIAFTSNRDGNGEIYVMNPDGSGQTNVSNHSANDTSPVWSPDGSMIAFSSNRTGTSQIWKMNGDGSGMMQVTNDPGVPSPGGTGAFTPTWSPDGSKIAFVSSRNGGFNALDIFVINADGTGEMPLATTAGVQETSPAWAPDNSKILYNRHSVFNNNELWTMNPDGSGQAVLLSHTTLGAQPSAPGWSPDAQKITFHGDQPGRGHRVYVANADGSSPTPLTDPPPPSNTNPAFAPEGGSIAFTSHRDGNCEIYVMDADGSNESRRTNNLACDDDPDWGPQPAPAKAAFATLAPKQATNPVGTPHTVTATVTDSAGNPVQGVTVRFSVTGANSASGAATTDANGQASFTYTGTTAGSDTIAAFADSDNDGTQDTGEPSDTAAKTWTPGPPATLTLAPAAATNTVGTEHCVTATVKDTFGNPVPDVTVAFSVPTSVATHASPSSGSEVTDASGEARFCFTASLPGQDAIHAFADTDQDERQDLGEPFGDATKTWTLPPNTELCEVTITEGGWIIANNGDRASFGGNAKVSADGSSVQGQQQYRDHGPAQPRTVHSIQLTATTCSDDLTSASIFGTATIDGSGTFVFRIDVIDHGEPGTDDAYGIILSDGYASGQQQLQGGNVKIHKS